MSDFSLFWASKREQLRDGYVDASGLSGEHCGLLAIEVAQHLKALGPQILRLRGAVVDGINTDALVPLPYGGRLRWGAHFVCVAGGVVYDPMLETPESLRRYPQRAFGAPVVADDVSWLIDSTPA